MQYLLKQLALKRLPLMPLLSPRHSINVEYELGTFTGCNPVFFSSLTLSLHLLTTVVGSCSCVCCYSQTCLWRSFTWGIKRTKVNDKLSFCLSFPFSVSLSSPPQSEVFNLPRSPGQGFGICQSPQACLGPQSSE